MTDEPTINFIRLAEWKAASAGQLAYRRGEPITANPHAENSYRVTRGKSVHAPTTERKKFTAWNKGYTKERSDDERRKQDAARKQTRTEQRNVKR